MSGKVLWIVFAAIVVSLALWLALVLLADRNYYRRAHREVSRGPAQDGRHV